MARTLSLHAQLRYKDKDKDIIYREEGIVRVNNVNDRSSESYCVETLIQGPQRTSSTAYKRPLVAQAANICLSKPF